MGLNRRPSCTAGCDCSVVDAHNEDRAMFTRLVLRSLFLSMFLVTRAAAGVVWLGPTVGIGVPSHDFRSYATAGTLIGGTAWVELSPEFALGVDLGGHSWGGSYTSDASASALLSTALNTPVLASVHWGAFQATLQARLMYPRTSQLRPYLLAGAGLYRAKVEVTNSLTRPGVNDSKQFGFNAGAGCLVTSRDGIGVGVNAVLHYVPSGPEWDQSMVSMTLGVSVLWSSRRQ